MTFWTEQAGPMFIVAFMSLMTGFPVVMDTQDGVVVRFGIHVNR